MYFVLPCHSVASIVCLPHPPPSAPRSITIHGILSPFLSHSRISRVSLSLTTPLDPSVSWKASLLHFSRWFEALADYLAVRHLESHIVDNSFPLASGFPLWDKKCLSLGVANDYRALTFVEIKLRCVSMIISVATWFQERDFLLIAGYLFCPLLLCDQCQFSILSASFPLANWY